MADLTYLIPLLLAVRIAIDLIGLASGGFSYRLALAYFVLFSIGAAVMLMHNPTDMWGFLALAVALFSLVQFFTKKARRRHDDSSAAT